MKRLIISLMVTILVFGEGFGLIRLANYIARHNPPFWVWGIFIFLGLFMLVYGTIELDEDDDENDEQ